MLDNLRQWPGDEPAKPVRYGLLDSPGEGSTRTSTVSCRSSPNHSAGKSDHHHHRHNKQAALLAATFGMWAPARSQAAWRPILDSSQLYLFFEEITPRLGLGANAPPRPSRRKSRGEPRSDEDIIIMGKRRQRDDHVHARSFGRETHPRAHRIVPSEPNVNKLPKCRLPGQPLASSKPTSWSGTLPRSYSGAQQMPRTPLVLAVWPGSRKCSVTCSSNFKSTSNMDHKSRVYWIGDSNSKLRRRELFQNSSFSTLHTICKAIPLGNVSLQVWA